MQHYCHAVNTSKHVTEMVEGVSEPWSRAMDMVKDSVLNGIWLNVAETAITG